ncbi:MAG: FKBP-type peptidyl-prolyl cis-trans isomerase [Gammaproteobacteria bacterium]|nr:FKBP-type peptidyl-prolyl cis-trans isomerase [Gammaproteobacteria bacterium]
MSQPIVAKNKVIAITYVLRSREGGVFEIRDLPVAYVHGGASDLFPKIEQALEGKGVGARVSVTLTPEEGFGAHDPKLTFTDEIENAPPDLRQIGMEFEAQNANGESMVFRVTRIADGKITVDANHPFAGQTVTFEVAVQDVRDATPEEIRLGRPADTNPAAIPTLQ